MLTLPKSSRKSRSCREPEAGDLRRLENNVREEACESALPPCPGTNESDGFHGEAWIQAPHFTGAVTTSHGTVQWLGDANLALASKHFETHRADYAAREPNLETQQFADELVKSSTGEDVLDMMESPDDRVEIGDVTAASGVDAKYLWLVAKDEVLLGLEHGSTGRSLSRGRLAHTNLSGGSPAHTGGELWFRDASSVWLNGGSGRYQPRCPEELESVVAATRSAGYSVCSAGWDSEQNRPQRFFRGDEPWL
jgi:hypothetical protein